MKQFFLTTVAILTLAVPLALGVTGALLGTGGAIAQSDGGRVRLTVRGSGLPVPRFVTLKSNEVNMRTGPGTEYAILWRYHLAGLPLRVDAEFGVWRKVVDRDGTTGWMHQSLVSLKRNVLVIDSSVRIFDEPDDTSRPVAIAERNALLELQSCPSKWCKVATSDVRGWVPRTALWGVLDGEILN